MKNKRKIISILNFGLTTLLITNFNIAMAQNWRIGGTGNPGTGGTPAIDIVTGANNMLGTPAGVDLRFGTNGGAERMRISSTGRVGIGLINPQSPLHVVGNSSLGSGWNRAKLYQSHITNLMTKSFIS